MVHCGPPVPTGVARHLAAGCHSRACHQAKSQDEYPSISPLTTYIGFYSYLGRSDLARPVWPLFAVGPLEGHATMFGKLLFGRGLAQKVAVISSTEGLRGMARSGQLSNVVQELVD
jgi:hypothetical protein